MYILFIITRELDYASAAHRKSYRALIELLLVLAGAAAETEEVEWIRRRLQGHVKVMWSLTLR